MKKPLWLPEYCPCALRICLWNDSLFIVLIWSFHRQPSMSAKRQRLPMALTDTARGVLLVLPALDGGLQSTQT
jgi:hypothetical protein